MTLFVGFYQNPHRHKRFVELLWQELGDIIFSRNFVNNSVKADELTLGAIKEEGKYLLIMYNDVPTVRGKPNNCSITPN